METKLTYLQENFAQNIVAGMNQTQAYKAAGYTWESMLPATLWDTASKLAANPEVTQRIQELRQPVVARVAWDLGRLVSEFEVNVVLGRTVDQRGMPVALAASNGALTGIGKALGILTDRVDVSVTHTLKPGLTLEELESRIARLDTLADSIPLAGSQDSKVIDGTMVDVQGVE
jgi:hypothetical protein